jgi:hypothetical protein
MMKWLLTLTLALAAPIFASRGVPLFAAETFDIAVYGGTSSGIVAENNNV